jgi:hypothetical protein
MATAEQVREWAASMGMTVGAKGRIPHSIQDQYDAAHPGTNGSGSTAGPDYPDDDFDLNFPDVSPGFIEPDGGPEDTAESPPRRIRSKAKPSGVRGMFGRGKKKAAGKKRPRVSTEDLLGAVWRGGAKLLTPLPPLQRTLRMQAPVAGLLLDDVVKDTAADLLLQPLARIAQQGKTVQALVGPPAFVSAIMAHQVQRAAMDPPKEPNPVFMALAFEGLRSSLMAWAEIAGPKFEIAMQREAEFEEKYGQSVDAMMAMIFAAPVDPNDVEAVMAEEEAIKRAQGIL